MTGYSDRITHAFAFAAKHHDQQVRKGTRLPYPTRPASVAVILTRYGQDENTVVAGILSDVVEDYLGDGHGREMLDQRVSLKFGTAVLDTLLGIAERRYDDDGMELSADERKDDLLARLAVASEAGRWVRAANAIHAASTILSDLRRTVDPASVWRRFMQGRDGTVHWYRALYERLVEVGFRAPIVDELGRVVEALDQAPLA